MTTTFMIEAMAAANAQLRLKKRKQEEVDDGDSTSEYSDDDVASGGRPAPESKPILSVQRSGGHVDNYDIVERVEMGQMASMFFNKGQLPLPPPRPLPQPLPLPLPQPLPRPLPSIFFFFLFFSICFLFFLLSFFPGSCCCCFSPQSVVCLLLSFNCQHLMASFL
ncbi:Transmembrane protein 104 [Liparis tanakae]|uniref:Transmembrane protein 104 n=1 Tax=Liparis tanakae TaxID=230148 RepID=A0A4Z2EFM8_9TELE|nr:Transmembrane protein 104 [Liparis tanakae]